MLKLTMDYKMTKHMLNSYTLKESRTWLLVCTRHCYFIPFNHEHPVGISQLFLMTGMFIADGMKDVPSPVVCCSSLNERLIILDDFAVLSSD